MKRLPLWTTLVPLVLGLGVYWWYWDRERADFQQTLAALFGDAVAVGGFPYRLEATVPAPRLRHDGPYAFSAEAAQGQFNRQPWKPMPVVAGLLQPRLAWQARGLDGVGAQLESATAQASLRTQGDRILRLSSVHQDARVRFPLVAVPATARSLEWHFRETPAAPDPASRAPTFPEQAQLVVAAEGLRFGSGDPLTLTAQLGLTSSLPVWDLANWRRGGTVELRRVTLADAHGEVATLVATGSASLSDPLRLVGTIDTVCPQSVAAAFAGTAAPATEYRTRRPVRLGIGGVAGALELMQATGPVRLPVRAQEPPCPKLRGAAAR